MAPHRYDFLLKIVKNIEGTFLRWERGPGQVPHSDFAVFHSNSSAVYFRVSIQQRGEGERVIRSFYAKCTIML